MDNQAAFWQRLRRLAAAYEELVTRPNVPEALGNGIYDRYQYPILTAQHAPPVLAL